MRRITTLGLILVSVTSALWAAPESKPEYRLASGADTVLLEYGHVIHMLAEPDTTPLLRIYGNGRVHVHYPVYMARAGDYTFRLRPKQLNELIASMEQGGLLDFDEKQVQQQRQQLQRQSGKLIYVSDATDTVIRVQLAQYRGQTGFDKTIRWRNVYTDSQTYPNLQPVQALRQFELQLQAMIDERLSRQRPVTREARQ